MGSFFKKVKALFIKEPEIVNDSVVFDPILNLGAQIQYFRDLTLHSDLAKLFIADSIPFGALPIYDLEGGDKEIITMEDGKPKFVRTDYSRITVQLQPTITEDDIVACLMFAAKYAQKIDDIYVDDYRKTGGWACVTGNRLETRLHKNIYVKDFPRTLLLPEPIHLGVLCQGTAQRTVDGIGLFMVLEKVRVV